MSCGPLGFIVLFEQEATRATACGQLWTLEERSTALGTK